MTKPVIIKREVKGQALTYAELDQNFQNLDDATITVTGDTGSIVNNLNDSFKISGGTGLTSSVSGTTLTVNLDNTAVTAGSYTAANITVDAQGRITAATSGTTSTPAGSDGQIQYNNAGAFGASSGLSYDGTSLRVNGNLESIYHNGDEGGEIFLHNPDTNTSISNGVTIDVFQNKLRIFENGGSNRGVYIDITAASNGVATNLLASTNPSVFSAYSVTGTSLGGTFVLITLDGEEYDTSGYFDSTTFYRFKPTIAGYYHISGIVGGGTSTVTQMGIWKNGASYKYGDTRNISCVVYFNGSTDYVQLYATGSGTTGTSMGAGSRLEGYFIRS